jgi:hypothetical protein
MQFVSEDDYVRAMIGFGVSSTSAPMAGQSLVNEELRSTSAPVYVGEALGSSVAVAPSSSDSSFSVSQPDLLTTWLN